MIAGTFRRTTSAALNKPTANPDAQSHKHAKGEIRVLASHREQGDIGVQRKDRGN